jgi:hypothetical protein
VRLLVQQSADALRLRLCAQAGHKTACAVKRDEREDSFFHNHTRAYAQQLVRGKDPVAALVADHEETIELLVERITALRSGTAVIIEIPQRIGRKVQPPTLSS